MSNFYTYVTTHRNKIVDIGYDGNGEKYIKKENYRPTIGIEDNKKSGFKNIHDQDLKIKTFKSINMWKDYVRENKDFIPLYGNISPEYQYIHDNYKEINFNFNFLKIFIIDIEVVSDNGFPMPEKAEVPINSLAIKDKHKGTYFVLSLKPYDKTKCIHKNIDPKLIKFKQCKNEEDLISTLIKILEKEKPDILVGYYSNGFDFPYIINRAYNILSDDEVKRMSLFRKVSTQTNEYEGKIEFKSEIEGIVLLDFLELYKKYTFTPRSFYTLDHISSVELKENKVDHEEYDNFSEFWEQDPQLFIDYNIYDVELIDMLEDHLGLISLHCNLSYKAKCNLNDSMGTVKIWDILIYNYLKDKNILIDPMIHKEFKQFAGAYVKEPIKKIYDWVCSIDLNSLYPHLIQEFQISPECLIDGYCIPELNKKVLDDRLLNKEIKVDPRAALAANGQYFRKDKKGFLPEIMKSLYSERKQVKKQMLIEKQKLVSIEEEIEKRKLI